MLSYAKHPSDPEFGFLHRGHRGRQEGTESWNEGIEYRDFIRRVNSPIGSVHSPQSLCDLRFVLCVLCGCDHETNYHNSESLFDRIKRFAVEGIGHGRVPRGATGKHDRSPDRPAAMKVNPIE